MEKRIIVLPDPIRLVTIPKTFSVSQIVAVDDCFLKVLMAIQGDSIARLLPNPSAELGKVFHSLLEKAVKGFSNGEDASLEGLEIVLDRLLNETRTKLEKDPQTASYADLPKTMTPLAWERKRRSLLDTAFDSINSMQYVKKTSPRVRNGGFGFEDAKGNGRWVEVPICVPALRLKGRMDVLERTGDEIKIIDLKSGRVENAEGEVKPKIVLQLLLYGILAQSLDPRARVSLVVNDGAVHPVPFDPEIVKETEAWLHSTMSSLVTGAIISAEEHAKVGPDCRWCGIRHRCARYLREAPDLWIREIDWRPPLDTWGTVERQVTKSNKLFDLTLLDAGGRRIKIFRVRETHLSEFKIGKTVWFFDLAASRPALGGNPWRHPLNFHEIGECDAIDRAWSLQVFVGRS